MPCPHYDIKIVQRSSRQSAVAAAAYQSGERLFSEYDQRQKYYPQKRGIVHTEILLPEGAPPAYADRNTLWNAAEAAEKQWNAQLARRIILAIPREVPKEQYADLLRDYCQKYFVSKGMIADFAIHDNGDGNPHAHILLTMRAVDGKGRWLPKSRKVYDLDGNGERIRLASGRWKSHKENTTDWNDRGKAEEWRQGWADTANRYLEAAGRTERLDLRSYKRQGIDRIPGAHLGPAMSHMEKKGIPTGTGRLNCEIGDANRSVQAVRQTVHSLKKRIADLCGKKAALMEAAGKAEQSAFMETAGQTTLYRLLSRYMQLSQEEHISGPAKDSPERHTDASAGVKAAVSFLQERKIATVGQLDARIDAISKRIVSIHAYQREKEKRMQAVRTALSHMEAYASNRPVYEEYESLGWKKKKEKFAQEHRAELDAYVSARRFLKGYEAKPTHSRIALLAEQTQLITELGAAREALAAARADFKVLRDVRCRVNHVLPLDERRAVPKPGKKASVTQELRLKSGNAGREAEPRARRSQEHGGREY